MTVAAVMLVKDEEDVLEPVLRHLAAQVDEIIVSDNMSTDGTEGILGDLYLEGLPLVLVKDDEPGYYQDTKTTALAMRALALGHQWVIPCDADEVWYAPDGRTLSQYLGGVPPDVQIVSAELYNHLPSALDPPASPCFPPCDECYEHSRYAVSRDGMTLASLAVPCLRRESNPLRRIGWRQREHAPLPKVCARLRPDLRIHMGNHSASTDGTALASAGLVIRHFSWRSPEQYLRKIRSGEAAYAAAPERAGYGDHWRMWEGKPDEAVVDHFHRWFWASDPHADATLIYDPAPASGGP